MSANRMRAGLVIALVVIASAIAGAAIERLVVSPTGHRGAAGGPGGGPGGPGGSGGRGGPGRNSPEREAGRRTQMLDKMTKDLSLTPVQRTAVDSVMQRTDSTLREIRREMEPRIESVFAQSRAAIEARLDSGQKVEFGKMARRRSRP